MEARCRCTEFRTAAAPGDAIPDDQLPWVQTLVGAFNEMREKFDRHQRWAIQEHGKITSRLSTLEPPLDASLADERDRMARLMDAVSMIEQNWTSLDDGRYAIAEAHFNELLLAYNELAPGWILMVEGQIR